MPAKPKHDTLARLLELLKALPHQSFATPSELREQLAERGFEVDVRSVQRDLKTLQASFPLEHNDKGRPHGWKWSEEAAGGIASMSTPEALMLVLVQQHLQAALPASMLEGFEALFARAQQCLNRFNSQSGPASWPSKVKAVAPGLPMARPVIDAEVQKNLALALLNDRQIDCSYAPGPSGPDRAYRLHPIGLILRGGSSYLVASDGGTSVAKLFALHRFRSVEVRPDIITLPQGLRLEAALKNGRGQFGVGSHGEAALQLRLACDQVIADLLCESPLGSGQRLSDMEDGRVEVQVTIADSWELRWWLLGRGAQVEVLAPTELRAEMVDSIRAAAQRYGLS